MAAPNETLLSVRAGTAEPPTMSLPQGQPIGPLSVGRSATWRVVAPGVLEEHGFVYFNGADLFVQSADMNNPITVNGAPIPDQWTAVYAPCEIGVGGARLWFGARHSPASMPAPMFGAPPMDSPSRSFAPRVQGNDDEESTRLQPIEELQAVAALRASKGPAPKGAVASKDPPSQTLKSPSVPTLEAAVLMANAQQPQPTFGAPPPTFGAPPPSMPAPMFGAPPPGMNAPPMVVPGPGAPPEVPAASAKESWIAKSWRQASGPKKALTVLMLPLIWAVWVIFTDPPPPPPRPAKATSASAAPSSSTSASGSAAPPAPQVETPPPATTSSAKAAGTSAPQATTGAKTPQREAADAVAAGSYDRAAKLYEDLAKANPSVPAYAEAARIMKAKANRH